MYKKGDFVWLNNGDLGYISSRIRPKDKYNPHTRCTINRVKDNLKRTCWVKRLDKYVSPLIIKCKARITLKTEYKPKNYKRSKPC